MLSEQRQYEIEAYVLRMGKASIVELAEQFGVSGETVRRDLSALTAGGRVRKVHGGAVATRHPVRDKSYAVRQIQDYESKQKIGERAAAVVSDGDTIGIDSGTCTEAFARALRGLKGLTVVTHSVPVATILAKKLADGELSGSVYLLGGCVCPETCTVYGMGTLRELENYHFDKVFLAATAISEMGVMAGTEEDGRMTAAYVGVSELSYVLAESGKLGKQSFYRCVGLDEITAIVTDTEHTLQASLKKALSAVGAEFIRV